ncbi:MAG: DNA polymerase I, partial [Clostridia bacterium]|nr:DNA polymerase I [Clostridia bacterium]
AEEEPARKDKDYEEAVLPAKDLAKALEGADEAGFSYDGTSAWFYAKGVLYRPEEKDMKSLEALLNGKLPPLTVHDCKTLYKRLEQDGIRWRDASFDVMLAAYVLQSGENDFSLQKLTVSYLHEVYDDTVPDAVYAQSLRAPMEEELEKTGQASVLADIEMPTAAVLADMELSGFKVDVDGIRSYGELLKRSAEELSQRIYLQAGTEFNILSPKQLGEVLFEKLGLPGGKKTKTGYSTNADVLQKLRFSHDIVDDILDYRQVTKLYSTYVEGLVNLADAQGRIHTTFNQTGTATGRLSSAEPNLQNIPVRTELGRELRKYFVAKDSDHVLIDADYSQIELRIMAHAANDGHMIDAFRSGEDIHTMTAARVFHRLPEQVTPDLRKRAKAINFGIIYGIGGHSLGEDLGISTAKATQYIEEYKSSYPGIDNYLKETVEKARKDGYVRTMFGRRRYIPELRDTNKNIQHFGERVAMNSPIQGAAADIIKMAMVRVHRELESSGIDAKIILQVHDELILESAKDCAEKAMEILVREMERTVDLRVPLVADAHTGDNWFDAK